VSNQPFVPRKVTFIYTGLVVPIKKGPVAGV
jgi:hypothetical protein